MFFSDDVKVSALMLEGMGFDVLLLDADCRIRYLSQSLASSLGRSSESLIGGACYQVLFDESSPCRACPGCQARGSGALTHGEFKVRLGACKTLHCEATALALSGVQGGVSGVMLALKDVGDQRRAAEALARGKQFDVLAARMTVRLVGQSSEVLPAGIEEALGELGRFLGAERCGIFEPVSEGGLESRFEWRASDSQHRDQGFRVLNPGQAPWFLECLDRQGVLVLPDSRELPAQGLAEKDRWMPPEVVSFAAVSIPLAPGESGVLYVESCSRPLSDRMPGLDRLTGVAEVLAGVLRRKKQGDHLREISRLFRCITESAPVLACIVDVEGRFTFCNRKWRDYTGWDISEKPEWNWEKVVHEEDQRGFLSRLQPSIAADRSILTELRLRRRDGTYRWMQLCGNPVRTEDGQVEGYVGVCIDITDHKAVEDQLLTLNDDLECLVSEQTRELRESNRSLADEVAERKVLEEQLRTEKAELEIAQKKLEEAFGELKAAQSQMLQREKMASIGQLAAGVAHEINNPMGFIISNLGSMKKYGEKMTEFFSLLQGRLETLLGAEPLADLDRERRRFKIDRILEDLPQLVEESLDGADRVKTIVQNLKGFSRIDSAENSEADINECLESAINIAWNEIKYNSVLHRDFGDIPRLRCSPQQLNQVFLNILVNASHAIQKDGEIRVSTRADDRYLTIAVSDNGCGIPEEISSRIFEPFFTTKEVGKGTGLGMSISYEIVKKHGGEILIQSDVGKGTTFTIVLPLDNPVGVPS